MSSTCFLSKPTLSHTAARTGASISSVYVSLKPPVFALVNAVLKALTITTSSPCFFPSSPMVWPGLATRRGCQFSSKPDSDLLATPSA
eukprot:CAMPEP_0169280382 /NCGR_PEP_ID=MMETSP1016-20121227/55574_1 /TAXON_ID=342587 /ORGANISM="Karlodinium micrum, Strain CCMP2283" /LENGTH=87 /DNA_ID=CAMNT_0009368697 /DNA_START=153 /DNA_END=413 /DNA_ORIENTATION=-